MTDYFRPATREEQAMGIIAVLCCEETIKTYKPKSKAKKESKQAAMDLGDSGASQDEENLAISGEIDYLREIPYFERHMINRYFLGNHFKGAEWWVADFEAYLEAIYETD